MFNIMTISTKQNPFLLFFKNNLSLLKSYYFSGRKISSTAHCFTVMMENKRCDWKIKSLTIVTFISKFQDKVCFSRLSSFCARNNVFFRFFGSTLFTIGIYTQTIPIVFRKKINVFAGFTTSTPFVSDTINYRFHYNSITYMQP